MSTLNTPSAFPLAVDCSAGTRVEYESGMTLRDWFAGHAVSPMLVQAYGTTPHILAKRAYEIADAMLAARDHASERTEP